MDLAYGGSASGDEETRDSQKGKKQYHRHSAQQIQQLEACFKECPHPDENHRQQLGKDIGLDPKQIKFWFQNKRTQKKAHNERADNNALRAENERIHCENLAMQEALRNIICPTCHGSGLEDEEKQHSLHRLRMENTLLKEEHERTINFFSNYIEKSPMPPPGIENIPKMPRSIFLGNGMGITAPKDLGQMPQHSEIPSSPYHSSGIQKMDKSIIIEIAISAMDELVDLLRAKDPVWINSPSDGRYILHRESYDKLFPKPNHFKSPSARMESSKDSGEVTWIEHVQVDDKSLNHRLYRDLVCGCQAYGAKRWIATLQRMCERFAFSMGLTTAPKHELEGVIDSRRSEKPNEAFSQNGQELHEVLSMSTKLDFPTCRIE
ncbi:hypothetical protein DH2020_046315 [Rehmannia glutinosa]|uniref:Uncharacterized protein n=1 Tax=Rehmannia glutinosa TaxID=99300 RepID=A0ABR0UCL2_REHGL